MGTYRWVIMYRDPPQKAPKPIACGTLRRQHHLRLCKPYPSISFTETGSAGGLTYAGIVPDAVRIVAAGPPGERRCHRRSVHQEVLRRDLGARRRSRARSKGIAARPTS
jgi:hypothetical protein